MSEFHKAADRLAYDMMVHAIRYFGDSDNADVLHEMRVLINSAIARIETPAIRSTEEVAEALGIKEVDRG